MTHLSYIIASYALAVLIGGGFGCAAWRRMARATARLAAIDPRAKAWDGSSRERA